MRSALVLLMVAIAGCAHPSLATAKPNSSRKTMPNAPCTKSITPADAPRLQKIVDELPDGAVLCLGEGRYEAQLFIERSLTIRGAGSTTILDARSCGSAVTVARHEVDLTIEQMVLRRGSGGGTGEGGNLSVDKAHRIVVRDVSFELGEADANGGGALMARSGEIVLEHCTMTGNRGSRAQAILLDGIASVTLRDCVVIADQGEAPAALVVGGAQLTLDHSTVIGSHGAVRVRGNNPTRPSLVVDASILGMPAIASEATNESPRITVRDSALSAAASGIEDLGGNVYGELRLDAEHRPIAGSIAEGRGPRLTKR